MRENRTYIFLYALGFYLSYIILRESSPSCSSLAPEKIGEISEGETYRIRRSFFFFLLIAVGKSLALFNHLSDAVAERRVRNRNTSVSPSF